MKSNFYSTNFEKLVREWTKKYPDHNDPKSYIGVGNPNAKILIVGRECATNETPEQIKQRGEISFADSWLAKIENNQPVEQDQLRFYYPAKEKPEERPGDKSRYIPLNGHTWVKYQKLYDLIARPGEIRRYRLGSQLDFLENVFTTEMNPNRAEQTKGVCTCGMQERKDNFFTSDFIQQFPIVILACGYDYIINCDDNREIDMMFGVEYVQLPNDGKNKIDGQNFYAHYNNDKTRPRLVINTQQLSGRINNDLFVAIADLCRPFYNGTAK